MLWNKYTHLISDFKPKCQEYAMEKGQSLIDGVETTVDHMKRIKLDPASHLHKSQLQMI